MSVSVVILTYNEEVNIGRCLDSVSWCDDVVVLDSFSTDSTEDIAKSKDARFYQRKFDDYASQRNHGLQEIEYKYPWVLMLDADEVVPERLYREIAGVLPAIDDDVALFRVRRKDYFFGGWIKHSTSYSSLWFGRLLRIGRVWVERAINEEYHTDGRVELLSEALHHYPFNKGVGAWLEKHNRYSTMEAELKFREGNQDWAFRDFIHSDPAVRRKSLKAVVYSMPGRPVFMFLGRYLITGGILDGRSGFTYCVLKSFYEYLIDCKLKELRRREKGLPV